MARYALNTTVLAVIPEARLVTTTAADRGCRFRRPSAYLQYKISLAIREMIDPVETREARLPWWIQLSQKENQPPPGRIVVPGLAGNVGRRRQSVWRPYMLVNLVKRSA